MNNKDTMNENKEQETKTRVLSDTVVLYGIFTIGDILFP